MFHRSLLIVQRVCYFLDFVTNLKLFSVVSLEKASFAY